MAMPRLENGDLDLPALTTRLGYQESQLRANRLDA